MKKTILSISILISLNGFSQSKADSIQQIKVNKFVDSIGKSPVQNFREFVYENVTAKRFDEFMQLYNEYLKAKYNEWMNKQKK